MKGNVSGYVKLLDVLDSVWHNAGNDAKFTSTFHVTSDCFLKEFKLTLYSIIKKIVSGYVCNHGSPSGERDTASPRLWAMLQDASFRRRSG